LINADCAEIANVSRRSKSLVWGNVAFARVRSRGYVNRRLAATQLPLAIQRIATPGASSVPACKRQCPVCTFVHATHRDLAQASLSSRYWEVGFLADSDPTATVWFWPV